MIIGIDASKAAMEKRTGVENFVYQLILHLQKIDKTNTYFLFTNKKLPNDLLGKNFREILIPFPFGWNKIRLPLALLKYKVDKYIQPAHTIPAFTPRDTIAVVHDLAWLKFPEAYTNKDLISQNNAIKNYESKAKKVICISKATEADLIELNPKFKNRTQVIHLAANLSVNSSKKSDILNENDNYFISLSRLEERKNTKNIVKAYYLFRQTAKDLNNTKLLLVGKPGYNYQAVIDEINRKPEFANDVIVPGFVENNELIGLLKNSVAFVYPSLYEGFGIPVLEAMQLGVPVITSNTSSLPEVAGDGALMVDPKNISEIANAMNKIVLDSSLRVELIERGHVQSAKFSWERTVKEFLKVVEDL